MRRLLAIAVGLVLVAVAAVAVTSCGGGGSGYKVRAIFDDASFVVPGEDVKISGVKVGKIDALHVTRDRKAAVTLAITDPGFQDFRRDASCTIRPQSLIGEQFVECSPTQGRASTSAPAPKLRKIASGPGKGEYLLPVERNSISVALDLLGDLNRLPVRQRLTLIINELGLGLAGRGEDLNAVVRRSAPALQELDKVVQLLATQNRQLKSLAVNGDTIMAPLARKRKDLTGFIRQSGKVAQATAERRQALQRGLERFPTFLRETSPTMRRLSAFADELTPIATDLRAQAPAINEVIRRTGPFSRAGLPALESLGDAAKPGIPAIRASIPITRQLRAFATEVRPVATTLAAVLTSFRRNDGLERFMDYAYYQAQAVNGFDSVSHFLRAGLVVNQCSTYATTASSSCASKFSGQDGGATAASRSLLSTNGDAILARTAAVLRGEDPDKVLANPRYRVAGDKEPSAPAKRKRTSRGSSGSASGSGSGGGTPSSGSGSGSAGSGSGSGGAKPSAPTATPAAPATGSAPAPAPSSTPAATPSAASSPEATQGPLLDFLFGGDQ